MLEKKKSGKLSGNRWSYLLKKLQALLRLLRRNMQKTILSPPFFMSLSFLPPLCSSCSLLCDSSACSHCVCIPSFYNFFFFFCSLLQAGRSRLGRWTSWNDLAIASWCFALSSFSSLFFPLPFYLYVSFSPFLLESMRCRSSSWEAPAKNPLSATEKVRRVFHASKNSKTNAAYDGSWKYSNVKVFDTFRECITPGVVKFYYSPNEIRLSWLYWQSSQFFARY